MVVQNCIKMTEKRKTEGKEAAHQLFQPDSITIQKIHLSKIFRHLRLHITDLALQGQNEPSSVWLAQRSAYAPKLDPLDLLPIH